MVLAVMSGHHPRPGRCRWCGVTASMDSPGAGETGTTRRKVVPVRPCTRCARSRRIQGRGLCSACYDWHRNRGSLDLYPVTGPEALLIRGNRGLDEIAVERALAGDKLALTIEERRLVVDVLTRKGVTARAIAERLGITTRSVVRHRATLRGARPEKPEPAFRAASVVAA
jgi:DNA-binding CsgD family transcriptional regulator